MPDVDGFELLDWVRHFRSEGGQVPAIALTAFARSEDRLRALEAGFWRIFRSRSNRSELIATVAVVGPTRPWEPRFTAPVNGAKQLAADVVVVPTQTRRCPTRNSLAFARLRNVVAEGGPEYACSDRDNFFSLDLGREYACPAAKTS
jgi:CheY-like chemotaxis protein